VILGLNEKGLKIEKKGEQKGKKREKY